MATMFLNASAFDQNIMNWDVSNATAMNAMFNGASSFNQDISSWDVSSVNNMAAMFMNACSFNQDLSSWCVELITEEPTNFDLRATSWVLPRPVWGTCSEN